MTLLRSENLGVNFKKIISLAIFMLLFSSAFCQNNPVSTKDSIRSFTYRLVNKALTKRKFKKIAVWDFTDPQKQTSKAGTYIADQVSIYATDIDSVIVLDRQNMESIIREHKLKDKDFLIDQQALLQLGKFSGAEVLAIGKVSIFEADCYIQLYLKIVDANTAQTLSAAEEYIPIDKKFIDASKMLINCEGADVKKLNNGEANNVTQRLKQLNCAESNIGECCFDNTTQNDFFVIVFKTPLNGNNQWTDWAWGPKEEFKLDAGKSKCIYSLPPGYSYRYVVSLTKNNIGSTGDEQYYDEGAISLRQCESKTYLIK